MTLKIYLDDARSLPPRLAKEGDWTVIRSAQGVMDLLKHGLDNIAELSLDNDLGEGSVQGYQVLDEIERRVIELGEHCPRIEVHSANPVARERMMKVIRALRIHN